MKNSNTKKTLVLMTVILVLVSTLLVVMSNMIEKKKSNIFSMKETIGNFEDGTSTVFLKRDIENNIENITKIDSVFIDQDREIDFLEEIEEVGRSAGVIVSIQDVSVEDVNRKRKVENEDGTVEAVDYRSHGVVLVSFSIEGEEENAVNFVSLLDGMGRKVSIRDMRLTKNSETSEWKGLFKITGVAN
ncbi:MAG: hypothetical protein ACI9GH_000084 [Candidatus Paceibacteria bacterium]|jgi:hypothetical protein